MALARFLWVSVCVGHKYDSIKELSVKPSVLRYVVVRELGAQEQSALDYRLCFTEIRYV